MSVTNFHIECHQWGKHEVVCLKWYHNGRLVGGGKYGVVLRADSGKHYHKERPSGMSAERFEIVQSFWPDVRSLRAAEERLLVPDNLRAVEAAEEAAK